MKKLLLVLLLGLSLNASSQECKNSEKAFGEARQYAIQAERRFAYGNAVKEHQEALKQLKIGLEVCDLNKRQKRDLGNVIKQIEQVVAEAIVIRDERLVDKKKREDTKPKIYVKGK